MPKMDTAAYPRELPSVLMALASCTSDTTPIYLRVDRKQRLRAPTIFQPSDHLPTGSLWAWHCELCNAYPVPRLRHL